MLARLKKVSKENAYVTFEAGRLDAAKTVIFFSGKNINRFELLYDRDILKDNNILLVKVKNLSLKRTLDLTALKVLETNWYAYNLMATSAKVLTKDEMALVANLPYKHIRISAVVMNNILYNKDRITQNKSLQTELLRVSYIIAPTWILLYSLIYQFILNKILQAVKHIIILSISSRVDKARTILPIIAVNKIIPVNKNI